MNVHTWRNRDLQRSHLNVRFRVDANFASTADMGASATYSVFADDVCFSNRAWRSSSSLSIRVVSSCAGHASFRGRRSGESRSCHKHWSDRVGVPCFQTRYDAQQTSAALPRLPRPHRTNCHESWSSCQAIKWSGRHLLLDAAEHGSIGPHGVEHDGKFAGNGDQRAFASLLAGQPGAEAAQG
jgi:hypothetical protein